METEETLFYFLCFQPVIPIIVDFCYFVITGKQRVNKKLIAICEIFILCFCQGGYIELGGSNDCCGHISYGNNDKTAIFSPEHQLTIFIVVFLYLIAYFYCKIREKTAPPMIEVVTNCFLLIGVIFNIFVCFQIGKTNLGLLFLGNLPILLCFILMLAENQQLFIQEQKENIDKNIDNQQYKNYFQKIAWQILSSKSFIKFPILLVLCLPILMVLSAFLLLFGQKPDSIIRAFTDTYRQGFSQWDYKCIGVKCPPPYSGGHYLCSVAANGHQNIVKPKRIGIRNSKEIICNRQLLVSNAFEDLIQEKMPFAHKIIRKNYDKIGVFVHKNYDFFRIKWVCDVVYVLMKPLEWFFLLTLYIFDRKPENRIAKQYISHEHRISIENSLRKS